MINYSADELDMIQKLELKILKEIIRICKKENIEYFLIGGSALGAIRHGGFIPWDDDIDVGMTRENYDNFLRVAEQYLGEEFYLQSPSSDRRSPYSYSKLMLKGTLFLEYAQRNLKTQSGIYVDIFPFDEVPDNESENERQFKAVQFYKKLYVMRMLPTVSKAPENLIQGLKAILRRCIHYSLKLIPKSLILKKIDQFSRLYNGTNQSAFACLDFPVRNVEYVLKTTLYPLVEHKFEEIIILLPGDFHQYLTTHYGEYMKLPPLEERVGHRPYLIDLGTYGKEEK